MFFRMQQFYFLIFMGKVILKNSGTWQGGGGGRHKAGKEFEEKGGEGLSIKYHKLPSNPIQNEQSLMSKSSSEITNLNKLQ